MGLAEELKRLLGSRLKANFPLAPLTTFGIGGPAEYFAEIEDRSELKKVGRLAKENGASVTLLGFGSNVLISDQGLSGLVIRLSGEFKDIVFDDDDGARAGAACRLQKFVTELAERGFEGMEAMVGVPGTVGGGLFMNAGTKDGEIRDHLLSVEVYAQAVGDFKNQAASSVDFGYRRSSFQGSGDIIVSALFKFPVAKSKEDLLYKIRNLMERRKATQPVDTKNVGSIFKNPTGDFAARIIEAAGLKGKRVGGAVVSPRHANFIVNEGGARAEDVAALMRVVRETVEEKFGVRLEPEVRFLGEFKK